jgi:hypothetical protein
VIPDELARAIAGRENWTIAGITAVYEPPRAGYLVRVRQAYQPARAAERWHAALIVRGVARLASLQYTAVAAVRWAEQVQPGALT